MTLYTTGCPRCEVLKKKMEQKGITDYNVCDSIDEMLRLGIYEVPILEVEENLLNFSEAVQYLNNLEE